MASIWGVSGTTATLKVDGKATIAITGLKSGLEAVADPDNEGDYIIEGIEVGSDTVTLSRSVLSNSKVAITTGKDQYSLDIDSDAKPKTADIWEIYGTTAILKNGTTDGYAVSDGGQSISYVAAVPGDTDIATISGLKSGTGNNASGGINGIEVDDDNGTIIVSSKSIIGNDGLTLTSDKYTFALDSLLQPSAAETPVWEVTNKSKGTAQFKANLSEGYVLKSDTTIKPVVSEEATVTVTGFKSGITADELNNGKKAEGETEAIKPAVSVAGSVITINDTSVLGSKLTVTGGSYTFAINPEADGAPGKPAETWLQKKNATSATLTQTIEVGENPGYVYYADGTTIEKLTKNKTTTLLTISGLPKASTTEDTDGIPEGINVSGKVITVSDGLLNTSKDDGGSKLGKDSEGNEIYGIKKLSIGNKDDYTFAIADESKPQDASEGVTWALGAKAGKDKETKEPIYTGNGTLTLKLETTDGWAVDTSAKGASKTINYVPAKTTNYFTLSGLTADFVDSETGELNSDFEFEQDEETKVYTGNILYVGGETEGEADTSDKVYAIKVIDGEEGKKIVTLNESVFGDKAITIKDNSKTTGTSYTLALDADYSVKDITEPQWELVASGKKITATLIGGKTDGYEVNAKGGITYTKAAQTKLATITIENSFLSEDGKKVDTETYAEQIAALGTALNAATTTELTTDAKGKQVASGTIKLDNTVLGDNVVGKLTIDSKSNYTFDIVDTDVDEEKGVTCYKKDADATPEWTVLYKESKTGVQTATGSATYGATMQNGYDLSSTKKVVTFVETDEPVTLVTLSGLDKTKSVEDLEAALNGEDTSAETDGEGATTAAATVDTTTKKVTINDSSILDGKKVSLGKNDGYTLDLTNIAVKDTAAPQWAFDAKRTTATYYTGKTAGYEPDKNSNISASYKAATVGTTLAKVTGLEAQPDASISITEVGGVKYINLTGAVLSRKTQAKLDSTALANSYQLRLSGVTSSSSDYKDPEISKGTVTINRKVEEGWNLSDDGSTVTYTAGVANQKAVTITGLNKEVNELATGDLVLNENTGVITIGKNLLNNANVTAKAAVKGEIYKLDLAEGIAQAAVNTTEWVNSKGTATYKTYDKGYYTASESTITYHKDGKATTLATIKGLNPTISGDAIDDYITIGEGNVITISSDALLTEESDTKATNKTTVTLSTVKGGKDYTLGLGDGQEVVYDDPKFAMNTKGNAAVLSAGVSKAGYELDDSTGLKLTYVPETVSVKGGGSETNSVTLATVNGVTTTSGLSPVTVESDDGEGGTTFTNVIQVSKDALGASKVTLGKNDNYTFRLVDEEDAVVDQFAAELSEEELSVKGTTATLNGVVSEAYSLSADAKTINYTAGTKEGKTTALATIKGVVKDEGTGEYDSETHTITIGSSDITTTVKKEVTQPQSATVDSAYGIAFNFDDTYENASVVGGKNADNIAVAGAGISINTAKGDDKVDLGTAGGNTFFYAVGDGNDVIANFSSTDNIKLTKAAVFSVEASGDDAVVNIAANAAGKNAGTITLTGMAGKAINIINSTATTPTAYTAAAATADLASSADLIYDNNNYVTGSQLGDLGKSADAGLVGDLNTNYNYTNLTQQQQTIAYSGNKK